MNEAWSLDKCKSWIQEEVLSGRTTWQKFLERVSAWQTKELLKHGNPPEGVAYIDQSLLNIQKAADLLGIFDEPKEEPKPEEKPQYRSSLFARLKEQE